MAVCIHGDIYLYMQGDIYLYMQTVSLDNILPCYEPTKLYQ